MSKAKLIAALDYGRREYDDAPPLTRVERKLVDAREQSAKLEDDRKKLNAAKKAANIYAQSYNTNDGQEPPNKVDDEDDATGGGGKKKQTRNRRNKTRKEKRINKTRKEKRNQKKGTQRNDHKEMKTTEWEKR